MVRIKNFSPVIVTLLLSLFCLTGCKKSIESFFKSNSYVTCNLNGKRYAADYQELLIFGATPDFYYRFQNGEGYFKFDVRCHSENKYNECPWFKIRIYLYLDKPLTIDTDYQVAVLPDIDSEDVYEAMNAYEEKKQSCCIIESANLSGFRFGYGIMRFRQINNPNEAYMGSFGFVFTPTPDSQGSDEKEMHLQGDFFITNIDRVFIEI